MKTGNTHDLLRGMAMRLAWRHAPDSHSAWQMTPPADGCVPDARSVLLSEVDFKWLMAGQGCWIDMPRFHDDPAYALAQLEKRQRSSTLALRQCATWLEDQLGQHTDQQPDLSDVSVHH